MVMMATMVAATTTTTTAMTIHCNANTPLPPRMANANIKMPGQLPAAREHHPQGMAVLYTRTTATATITTPSLCILSSTTYQIPPPRARSPTLATSGMGPRVVAMHLLIPASPLILRLVNQRMMTSMGSLGRQHHTRKCLMTTPKWLPRMDPSTRLREMILSSRR